MRAELIAREALVYQPSQKKKLIIFKYRPQNEFLLKALESKKHQLTLTC